MHIVHFIFLPVFTCVGGRKGERHMHKNMDNYLNAAAAKSFQSCPTLCHPIDGSPPGSPIPGILQARTLEWVAISFSNAWKWKVKVKSLSRVWLLATPWTAVFQAPPSMGFSRQQYCSGVPLPSSNYLNNLVQKRLLWLCIPGVVIKPIKTLIAVLIHERKSDLHFGGKSISFGDLPRWLSGKEST